MHALETSAGNSEVEVRIEDTGVILEGRCADRTVFAATVTATDAQDKPIAGAGLLGKLRTAAHKDAEGMMCVTLSATDGITLTLAAEATGQDIFPCEPRQRPSALPLMRAVSGQSHSALNTGVYCRQEDWALEVDASDVTISPATGDDAIQACPISASGAAITVTLIADYFRIHHGLPFFRPAEYTVPEKVPCGWISWYAYHVKISEEDVKHVAAWGEENLLREYGMEYMIIDDGWFGGSKRSLFNVPPEVDWTTDNGQFPSGMKAAADAIHEKGFKAGIWISPWGCSGEELETHPDWWVREKADGDILKATWHGFAFMDASNPEAVDKWLLNGVRAQKANGFDYFKFDGMMHVAYDAYKNTTNYFPKKGTTWQEAFRHGWQCLKDAAGESSYLMACWNRIPELVGLPYAMRTGGDKHGEWNHVRLVAQDLAKDYREHNIAWCVDPDHMVMDGISVPASRSWATLVGLTGTHMTFSDKPEAYIPEKLDVLRRIMPVISGPTTRPAVLSDVTNAKMVTLEVTRAFDNWLVVANTAALEPVEALVFADLGLDPTQPYAVYDFWQHTYKGVHTGSYACGMPDEEDTQVFGIRAIRNTPWLIATNRHISMGGVDLVDVNWQPETKTLSGTSHVVKNDPYALVIHVPAGYKASSASVNGQEVTPKELGDDAVECLYTPDTTATIDWQVVFA